MSGNTSEKMVVIGEGLSAGFGPFTLNQWAQRFSFPSFIAQQVGIGFPQPLFEAPGICSAPGFEQQPVILPTIAQATVLDRIPPVEFANLSVPGMSLADALTRRPRAPWVMRDDPLQTACNFIVGAHRMATNAELLTPVENAAAQNATVILICLGYAEALNAAVASGAGTAWQSMMPEPALFGSQYASMLSALTHSRLLVFTVPDPFDTPFFQRPPHAARVLRVEESWLRSQYELADDDYLQAPAVHEAGYQIFARSFGPLRPHSTVSGAVAAAISERIESWNAQIHEVAGKHGALVYDLHGLFKRLIRDGILVGTRRLSADYLGGIYSLNGYYPGFTGHALIANEVLELMNQPLLDLDDIASVDPSAQIEPAGGPLWSPAQLIGFTRAAARGVDFADASRDAGDKRDSGASLPQLPVLTYDAYPKKLVLPPDLRQEIPLDRRGSYFGDGISAANCECRVDGQFDGAGNTLFGGVALVDSHLSGTLRFEFFPIGPDKAEFKLRFEPLTGEDSILSAPVLFRMPFEQTSVSAYPEPYDVSSGEIDLNTGYASRLRVFAKFDAIALRVLVGANHDFPTSPLGFVSYDATISPLEYGSAWARFEQRPDGKLDFTFYGSRFVPLGPDARWPLNFAGTDGRHATIPASGTAMHPHLRLTTKPYARQAGGKPVDLPFNTLRELTCHTHNTAFGDGFDLRVPELGGPSTGRSHVLGRTVVQFGIPSGGTVPISIRNLSPGGIFSQAYPSPITDSFPVRLPPGPRGFDQRLRYPRATFSMEKISLPDDPFDPAVGAVDLETGFLFNDHLHRAFIEQDVINALMRIEPRVRHTSFFFRGPGLFVNTPDKGLMFRFQGDELLPYAPAGLAYPQPDFTSSYYAGPGATLNPYLWIRAIEDGPPGGHVAEGKFTGLVAANRDEFSVEYRIPSDTGKQDCYFSYKNETQLGSFTMYSLTWVGFGNSAGSSPTAGFDTATFSGLGLWEKNGVRSVEQVAAQIWSNPKDPLSPYIGIQISSGEVSNVDTRPVDFKVAMP